MNVDLMCMHIIIQGNECAYMHACVLFHIVARVNCYNTLYVVSEVVEQNMPTNRIYRYMYDTGTVTTGDHRNNPDWSADRIRGVRSQQSQDGA